MKKRTKNEKYNLIILIVVFLLFLLLIMLMALIKAYQEDDSETSNTVGVTIVTNDEDSSLKTVKEIVESYGSEYIETEKKVFIEIYVHFLYDLYDLYDEDGNSQKTYFYDMIDDIVEVEKASFYLIDEEKNIEIFVVYDEEKDTYTVRINNSETYYEDTDGDTYIALQNAGIVSQSTSFAVTNTYISTLTSNSMKYSGTTLFPQETRIDLGNGYYSVENGTVLGRLQIGKVLNLLFEEGYEDEIAKGITVGTSLKTIYEKHSDTAFGSVSDGYLGYRTANEYVFFYKDEVSVYGYNYAANSYFDEYLSEYCLTGDLETLYNNFTESWTTYFENEFDADTGTLRLTYPLRGIEIDIKNNDSTGIKIYSNYYLTDTVTQLIKDGKITYIGDKDLINETEKTRRAGN